MEKRDRETVDCYHAECLRMIAENTAGFVFGGKHREDKLYDALHPKKKEEIKDPEAEAVKRLNRMGLEVV